MFAYLWVIENPADELRLRRIINTPARKIGDKSVETAMQLAVEYGTTLYDVVCHASQYPALSRGAAAMEKFGEMIENLRKLREFVSLSELYDELMDKSGYIRALQLKGGAEEESRIEHIEELKSYIVDYEDKTETPSLGDFLENMALYTDADQSGEDDDAVIMMTMHAAKGLEFPVVFLAGMEDGLFPGFRANGEGRGHGGGTPPVLRCRHPREGAAVSHLRGAPPAVRPHAVFASVALY